MWLLLVFGAAALAYYALFIGNREDAKRRANRELYQEEVDIRSLKDDPERRKRVVEGMRKRKK